MGAPVCVCTLWMVLGTHTGSARAHLHTHTQCSRPVARTVPPPVRRTGRRYTARPPARPARRTRPTLPIQPAPPPPPSQSAPAASKADKAKHGAVSAQTLDQNERAFQKQAALSHSYKKSATAKGKGARWTRSVGLGYKTPEAAVKGTYVDKKCPFTGNVAIRGRILKGVVISTKMARTIVLRRD